MWRGAASARLRLHQLPISGINIYEPAPPTGPTQQPLDTLGECLVAGPRRRVGAGEWARSNSLPLHVAGNFHGWYIKTEKLLHNLR